MRFYNYCFALLLAHGASAYCPITSSTNEVVQAGQPGTTAVSGRVLDPAGAGMPGVVVTVQGTANSTTTNSAGSFLLMVDVANPVLIFSRLGYQTQAVTVPGRNAVILSLYPVGTVVPTAESLAASGSAVSFTDEPATFPGGDDAYRNYMLANVHYPEKARLQALPGTVYVSFIVDEVGRILDVQVVRGSGNGFDEEAVRLVRLMPWWTPGRLAGKNVRSACTLRIRFGVEEK